MRYRRPRDEKDLRGQVFTPATIAAHLAGLLATRHRTLLDLGAGQGALIEAARQRCENGRFTAVEIDRMNVKALSRLGSHVEVHRADVFDAARLNDILGRRLYGAAIGNPPFGTRRPQGSATREAEAFTFQGWLHEDLYFFVQAWRRVRRGGELAMILTGSSLTSANHQAFRRWLLNHASELLVMELPRMAFVGAEVQSYVVHAIKGKGAPLSRITLQRLGDDGAIGDPIHIAAEQGLQRMDFTYYKTIRDCPALLSNAPTLSMMDVRLIRGTCSRNEFEAMHIPNVHTTNFREATTNMRLTSYAGENLTLAEPGDILVPRVGSRCLLRQAYIVSGRQPITDAVFRLRAPKIYRRRILDTFAGETGQRWREAHARGSCARYLTVSDLLAMPVTG